MDPSTLLLLAAVLICPVGMGVMMWMMNRHMSSHADPSMPGSETPTDSAQRLAALRAQRQALEAEIAEVTRLADLENQRRASMAGRASERGSVFDNQ